MGEQAEHSVFGAWIKQRRKALDLTQQELAALVGCSVMLIRKIESGARRPSKQIAEALMRHLRIEPERQAEFVQLARLGRSSAAAGPPAHGSGPVPASQSLRSTIPRLPTPLIGRAAEVDAITALLQRDDVRLVTLSGPPGVGKTLLALATGWALGPAYEEGVVFVELASIHDPALVAGMISQTLGASAAGHESARQHLERMLATRRMLVILDTFEHVVSAAGLIAQLLAACPGLDFLVTSRAGLGLRSERQFSVPPLATPDPADREAPSSVGLYPAVALFVQRVQSSNAAFQLTDDNAAAVAALCRFLEGLPLALELAAARINIFSPTSMLAQLTNRLILASAAPDVPARHRTLRTAIDWSHALLADTERRLFRRLGLFVGTWSLAAVQEIYAASDDLQPTLYDDMTSLINKSLVRQAGSLAGEPLFSMLDVLRDYALERLSEAGEALAAGRHYVAVYLALAQTATAALGGPGHRAALEQLVHGYENIRAALSWSLTHGMLETAVDFCAALWDFWRQQGRQHEARQHMASVLSTATPQAGPAYRTLLYGYAWILFDQDEVAQATALFQHSMTLACEAEDHHAFARSLHGLGAIRMAAGDYEQANALYAQSMEIFRALGDGMEIAWTFDHLARVARRQGRYAEAQTWLEEAVALFQGLGCKHGLAWALEHLGNVAARQGRMEQALRFLEEAIVLFEELGNQQGLAWGLQHCIRTLIAAREVARAYPLIPRAMRLFYDLGSAHGMALCLRALIEVQVHAGRLEDAAELAGAAETLLPSDADRGVDAATYRDTLAGLRQQLGPAAFLVSFTRGQLLPLKQLIARAGAGAAA